MSDKKSNNGSWFFSALTLLFIGLKLTHYITWSWLWVLAPVWMPVSAVIAGFVLYLLIDWAYKPKLSDIQRRIKEEQDRQDILIRTSIEIQKGTQEIIERYYNARSN